MILQKKVYNILYSEQMKQYRIDCKLSQQTLSIALGLSSAQLISKVERGVCRYPLSKLKDLSVIFQTNLTLLIEMEVCAHRTKVLNITAT